MKLKKVKLSEIKFKGYDYSEFGDWLAKHLKRTKFVDPAEDIADCLRGYEWCEHLTEVDLARVARKFLKALSKHDGNYVTPLWLGLLAITDDEVFLKYFTRLLPYMWC
jgi:hypothetical protein